jgi:hypothetical protein
MATFYRITVGTPIIKPTASTGSGTENGVVARKKRRFQRRILAKDATL